MNKALSLLFFLTVLFLGTAQAAETWSFRSDYDSFTLEKKGSAFYFNDEKVNGQWAEELRPVVMNPLPLACPDLPKKPDLTLTWKSGQTETQRFFYLIKKIAGDGKNCIELSGLGIYYAPYHRHWFVGDEKLTLDVTKGFSIGDKKQKWGDFVLKEGRISPQDPEFFANWSTLADFRKLMLDFPVEGRAHPQILKDIDHDPLFPVIELKTKGRVYKFHKVKRNTWLMEMPGIPWLILSSNFGTFEGMTAANWVSPLTEPLKKLANRSLPAEERARVARGLKSESSPDVRRVFHDILLERGEDIEVKEALVDVLRFYPSDDNMSVLADALEKTDHRELVEQIIKVLRLRNPKGPQIEPTDDWPEIQSTVQKWKDWAKKFERPY